MQYAIIDGKRIGSYCACDREFPTGHTGVLCYGDRVCEKCHFYPWASNEANARILNKSGWTRKQMKNNSCR